MTTQMTIFDDDWSTEGITEGWLDSEPEHVARDAADTEVAYVINNLGRLRGWEFNAATGTFAGPARPDALGLITGLFVEAADFAIEHLDEIRTEAA